MSNSDKLTQDPKIVRDRLEQEYFEKMQEGKRMRKDREQMEILVSEFQRSNKWSYKDKIRIAEQIGMTFHQVSKWNWDYRKKMGIDTSRKKNPK